MVGVLIRMKVAIIRHSMTGSKAAWMVTGGVVGTVLAVATIWLGLMRAGHPTVVPDLLATVYLMWMLGWVVGPVWSGSGVLQSDHFTLLPIPRHRLAVGLLGAAFVGITTAVTLLAFLSLVVYGARLGLVPALIALPAVLLQLALVVLLSRVAAGFLGVVAEARTGAALNGVLVAGMMVVSQSGWMILVALPMSGVLETGFPAAYSNAVRVVPSGWGLAAIEAADRSAWLLTLAALAGLLAVIVALLLAWSRTLGAPRSERVTIRGSQHAEPADGGLFAGRAGAVLRKELRTWWRDPGRTMQIVAPLVWALGTTLLPLTFGVKLLLPWTAPLLALISATFLVNQYGQDGTALWLTLQTATERVDLRARQWAYLLVFGPIALLVAVASTAWSGLTWAWPWVLSLTPAMLGGGVGLVALVSVIALVPGPDAHKRRDNPMEHADTTGTAFLMFFLAPLVAVPAVAVVLAGTLLDSDALRWAGVPVGILTGVLLGWWLGRIAYRRLEARGPELLFLMRTGRPGETAKPEIEVTAPSTAMQTLGWTFGSIALFPQGLLPILFKLTGNDDVKVWFLAMHLPGVLGWITAVLMILVGAHLYYLAIKDLRNPKRKRPMPPKDDPDSSPRVHRTTRPVSRSRPSPR